MPEQSERVITWGEVLPGDVIRGADGGQWVISARVLIAHSLFAPIVMSSQVNASELSGTPRKDSAVTLLSGGDLRTAMDTFTAAGLPAHYEGTEQS